MILNPAEFLVNVPALSPVTFPHAPALVRFLNPGLPLAPGEDVWFRPDNLPMGEAVAQAMLAQFAQMAWEARRPGDISAFAQAHNEDFHSGTSFAIRDQIRAAQSGKQSELETQKALFRAQKELCLAWALEQSAVELSGLEDKLDSQWAAFEESLGLEKGDSLEGEAADLAGAKPDLVPSAPRVPMPVLMESVLAFLPKGCGLYCADQNLLADWEEFGVSFAKASADTLTRFGLTGQYREAIAPGYLLCLSKRAHEAKPWLVTPRLVVAPGEK